MLSSALLGIWLYAGMIYNDNPIHPPGPDNVMRFEFHEDGTDTLFYKRKSEVGFCERKAKFIFDGKELYQEVIWVNPGNAIWCDRDSDMQMGMKGSNDARLNAEGVFELDLPLGDEKIILLWKKQLPQ